MSDRSSTSYDQREKLFDRAKVGEITGDQADAEAIRLGLGSLSTRPGPEAFRPEAITNWTIPMALAWIVYLDLDKVRDWHAPYRAECWRWIHRQWRVGLDGPVRSGWLLEQCRPPTLSLFNTSLAVDAVASEGPQPTMSAREARESLWYMLRDGFLKASGIDLNTGRRREIPALEWHELVPVEGRSEVDEVRLGLLGEGYRDVLLPSAIVRSYWHKKDPALEQLPDLMPPTGLGYLPLYCAAQWIATEGGRVDFSLSDEPRWKAAFDELLAAISSEKVRVTGIRDGLRAPVLPAVFAALRVFYPSGNADDAFLSRGEAYLQSWPYIDEEYWRGGFDDRITSRHQLQWAGLMVEKGDVRALWPFTAEEPLRTGAPGRPSSSHLILAELERRALAGTMEMRVGAEARALAEWLKKTHPQYPATTAENIIRDRHKVLKATK